MFVVVIFNSLYILSCLQVVVNNFFIFSLLSFFRGNSDILSCLSLFVNNFFSAIYSVGAQYHLALSDQNCSARVSFVIIPPSSNFVNQKLQIKLYSDNLCCILKLLYHAFYFSFISHSLRLNCIQCLPDICHPDQLHCILLPYRRKGYFWQNAYFKTEFGCLCHTLFCHAYTTHFPA